ncbi:hypothetical protein [Sporolactobacillus putidus]|uniref:hypothetical protein n=1 Tax=Sporolactobacillus putidus TaxID=492735 RepID=UPI00166D80D3|nr:hypothetical protein [Sporolactobacillus putidus]
MEQLKAEPAFRTLPTGQAACPFSDEEVKHSAGASKLRIGRSAPVKIPGAMHRRPSFSAPERLSAACKSDLLPHYGCRK